MSKTPAQRSFDDQLVLFSYFLHQLGLDSLSALGEQLNSSELEGLDERGGTLFCGCISRLCQARGAALSPQQLRLYDENICRHTRRLAEKRGELRWKYFQYTALLFTEMYLDRYFTDPAAFCRELNAWLAAGPCPEFTPYTPDRLNKLAYMCATGSGKTLILHMNILQFLHYFRRARCTNHRLSLNRIILLAPNETMSRQHLEELALSSIPAALFEKGGLAAGDGVVVVDMNKLKDEGKIKTVSVDSFERNNLVLVDEGHRGLWGDAWYDYRSRLSADGFAFEYSATFRQALNAGARRADERALMEEYGKSILMDYSYKHFYRDGYGKDYRIYNLRDSIDREQQQLYLTGCLLSFYQQQKLFSVCGPQLRDFRLEKPLLVFVGNRVTARTSKSELTDVEEVVDFLHRFLRDRSDSIRRIRAVLQDDTGLVDSGGNELFFQDFQALREWFGPVPDPAEVFSDLLRLVFNFSSASDEPRLHLDSLRQVPGEIGLRVGAYGPYFGVLNIGDTAGLLRSCEAKSGIVAGSNQLITRSLFEQINRPDSPISVLIGARKFTEGWNSWRVSTMGLINFAKGEGAQAIQLFGRGVRLRGYGGSLKRSARLRLPVQPPRHLRLLETLTIFGVKAQYMEEFKRYLAWEGAPANQDVLEFHLPAVSRWDQVRDRQLPVIRLREGPGFRQQARLLLAPPDADFLRYLAGHPTVIDCRSKVQTIHSVPGLALKSAPDQLTIPPEYLPLLDYPRIFQALEARKAERGYFNLSIPAGGLMEILSGGDWYRLLIPKNHLEIRSMADLAALTDYAVMALSCYLDKFYQYHRARWEVPRLTYGALGPEDGNFVGEYTLTYTRQGQLDAAGEELAAFVSELTARGVPAGGRRETLRGRLGALDLPAHLYTPLLYLEGGLPNLQTCPAALNRGERLFVEQLKACLEDRGGRWDGRSVYLLRNKSRAGMGFFQAGNFHPDFILWLDGGDRRYLTFLDPKGLLHVRPDDPKVEFYRTIKELERRLAPTAEGGPVVLNSFLLSSTPQAVLQQWWGMDRAQRQARHVYTLDDPRCVESILEQILLSP